LSALQAVGVFRDWTAGCIAVTNAEIEEIYRLVPIGTRIVIKP
jgi:lipoprotein-anchoring transpeptidase ErfK/SrfK